MVILKIMVRDVSAEGTVLGTADGSKDDTVDGAAHGAADKTKKD